ncbi:MAG: transglutaminase domain-containing protein [Chitinophagaceae bacterium]
MKLAAIILFFLFAQTISAQQKQTSFAEIDEWVKTIEPAPAAQLARTLTQNFTTDQQKLRSIFSWITEHIAYRVRKKYNAITVNNNGARSTYIDSSLLFSANEMVADLVLQSRSAVCDGYSRLFKTLCDYAGLRSVIISGFAKGDWSRPIKFRCNHTWNAVYLDSSWQLLDVTWASGYTSYSGDEFYKRFDASYYLSPPDVFARDHFPDDLRWSLMESPQCPRDINNAPYKTRAFTKYNINSFIPDQGVIEATIGDTIQIVLQTNDAKADSRVAPDTLVAFDSSLQKISASIALIEPSAANKNKEMLQYTFCVEDSHVEWVHIVYNHDTVLRYRLKIKKEKINPVIAGNYPSRNFLP